MDKQLDSNVKDSKLLVSSRKENDGSYHQVIKRKISPDSVLEVKLSQVIHKLPFGLVYKDETGMGATTLELKAERNSIIVEPIRITASSKAYGSDSNYFYVGSKTRYHKSGTDSTRLKAYIEDESIPFKKFLVVADSLPTLIRALGPKIDSFFLLIDEIDSFQLDSTFRRSMEDAIDVYKKHPGNLRAMLSATRIEFSDPELNNESETVFSYDKPLQSSISLIRSMPDSFMGNATETIISNLTAYPDEKHFVAFNSPSGCMTIIKYLRDNGHIQQSEIKILCGASERSKNTTQEYFHELDSDHLPAKLNFVTSAYFTGFDLNESYHLISLSQNRGWRLLSESRIKQIAGRSRTGLLSHTIVHDYVVVPEFETLLTKDELVKIASVQVTALNCMKTSFEKDPYLSKYTRTYLNNLLSSFDSTQNRYVRIDENEEFKVSFLNIDAVLEAQRVSLELYQKPEQLELKLTKLGFQVTAIEKRSELTITEESTSADKSAEYQQIAEFISTSEDLRELRDNVRFQQFNGAQIGIVNKCLFLLHYYEYGPFISLFTNLAKLKSPNKSINRFLTQHYLYLLPESNVLKQQVHVLFPLKEKQTKEIINKKINKLLQLYGITHSIKSENNTMSVLKLLVKVSKQGSVTTIHQHFPMSESITPYLPDRSDLSEADQGIVRSYMYNYVSTLT
jgi:hypothetical protein